MTVPGRFAARILLVACCAASVSASKATGAGSSEDWQVTLDRVVPAVVALRVSAARAFDTAAPRVANATGFVVDADRGLILTNRHVVGPGPVTAEAVFLNHEKVDVVAVYRDPVHDFGLFRFEPAAVRFMELREIPLAPERAQVGTEIRVIGNDAGEKLSILDGTLARLDRDAPRYGKNRYNDFNTFYLQAASSTSGGSSGSPVVDRSGRAVALNAGANRRSSASFFLPLDRVVRALHHIQAGEPVPRGTLQTVFRYESFDELRRLGVGPETEARVRRAAPGGTGMLVVAETVPGGPADGVLRPGDVLTGVGGRLVTGFAPLEAALDDAVGQELALAFERAGQPLELTIRVGDLHEVTPRRYLETGGAVLHALSYQQARNFRMPAGGVYVADPGYVLARARVPAQAVVTAVDGRPVADLASFESLLAGLPDGERVPLRYLLSSDPRNSRVAVLSVDRRWFPMRLCERDDAAGTWPCRVSLPAPPLPPREPVTTHYSVEGPKAARAVAPSLVFVEFNVPFHLDGVHGSRFSGAGLVLDAEAGVVAVDRDTVPTSLGDLTLTFAGSVSIPGRVVGFHPEHNLSVLSYDPALLGDTPVRSASLRPGHLDVGDAVWLVGLNARQEIVSRRTEVARFESTSLPIPALPRFRESNLELAIVTESISTLGGVLADGKGRILAMWSSFSSDDRGKPRAFFAGMPVEVVGDALAALRSERGLRWRTLGAELEPLPLSEARARGLSAERSQWIEEHDPTRRRVFAVARVAADTEAVGRLEPGDLLLAVNEAPVGSFRDVERAAREPELVLRVLRAGQELELRVPTTEIDGGGTRRALAWAGALLQAPPRAVSSQRGLPRQGVYVAGRWRGSPADRHGLRASVRILAVNGEPTPDLDRFLAALEEVPRRGPLRLDTETVDGKPAVITLELDPEYWPSFELRRNGEGWVRSEEGSAVHEAVDP